jgi:GH18 family chitinase
MAKSNAVFYTVCGVVCLASVAVIAIRQVSKTRTGRELTAVHAAYQKVGYLTEIEIYPDFEDVGDIRHGEVLHKNYRFLNIGKDSLVIYNVMPSCDCTDFNLSKQRAAPGDSIIVELIIDTIDKNLGHIIQTTLVEANTAEHFHRLAFEGNVVE